MPSQPPASAESSAAVPTPSSAGVSAQIEYLNGFGGWFGGMALNGSYAYLAEGSGIMVLDITNADAPARIARLPLSSRAHDLQLVGNRLYINIASALVIADVTQAAAPVIAGIFSSADGDIFAMHIVGTQAYITTNGVYDSTTQSYINKGLDILDLANAAAPVRLGHYETSDSAGMIFVAANRAYVSHADPSASGLYIFDVSNSAKPQLLANHISPDHANIIVRQVVNSIAYVIQDRGLSNTLELVDISTPGSWNVRGSIALYAAYDLRLIGSRAYVAGRNLDIVDVSALTKPVLLGSYQLSHTILAFQVAGTIAYTSLANSRFQALDVSTPGAVIPRGSYVTMSNPLHLAVANSNLYAVGELAQSLPTKDLTIYGISDPANAQQISRTAGIAGNDLAVAGRYAYLTTDSGLQIVDIANPISPTLRSALALTPQSPRQIVVSNKIAYIASDFALIIVDVSDAAHPFTISTYPLALGGARDLHIAGARAYVSGIYAVHIFDIGDPHAPRMLGSYPVGAFAIAAERNIMYVASDEFESTSAGLAGHIDIVDVGNPQTPVVIGTYNLPALAQDLFIQNSLLYILDTQAVEIADISDPTDPVQIASATNSWAPNHFIISGDLLYTNSTVGASTNILRANPAGLLLKGATITAAGGALASGDNRVRLVFPAGAVAGPVTVTYQGQAQAMHVLPGGFNLIRSFALAASDANGQPVTHFAKPYTLTIDYTEAALAALGGDEAALNIAYWNGSAWAPLLPCAGCAIDTLNNRVTAVLDHFSEFALISSAPNSGHRLYLSLMRH